LDDLEKAFNRMNEALRKATRGVDEKAVEEIGAFGSTFRKWLFLDPRGSGGND
jgi:hypothetical protein